MWCRQLPESVRRWGQKSWRRSQGLRSGCDRGTTRQIRDGLEEQLAFPKIWPVVLFHLLVDCFLRRKNSMFNSACVFGAGETCTSLDEFLDGSNVLWWNLDGSLRPCKVRFVQRGYIPANRLVGVDGQVGIHW